MAAQTQEYIQIDEVINGYLDRSEQSNHKYFKCWNIAFDGMNKLGLDFFYQVRSVKLPINPNLTVNLPDDYLNYSKIGVFNEKGEVIPLYYNSKLTTYADLNPNRATKTEDNTLIMDFAFNSPNFNNFWNGYWYTPIFGLPGGAPFVGSFKIDSTNGIILLSENFSYNYICLEYIASPVVGGIYRLPIQFKDALMWYIAWHDISMMPNSRKGGLGDKEQRRKNYFNERRLARAQWRPFRIEQAYQENLRNQRLTVKV